MRERAKILKMKEDASDRVVTEQLNLEKKIGQVETNNFETENLNKNNISN